MFYCLFLMIRRPPRPTRTSALFPYTTLFRSGRLDLGISGTHIFSIIKQLSPGSVSSDFVGLYASPVKWRLRGRLGWAKGGFAANAFVNYTDGYRNQVVIPNEHVSSWTTVDLTLSQRIGQRADETDGRGLQLSLALHNLFDRDPPYA